MEFLVSKHLVARVAFLERQVEGLQERNDRLTEALAQRSGIDLVLPRTVHPPEPAPGPVGGNGAEEVNTWWKSMNSGGKIASPVKTSKENIANAKSSS